MNFNVRDIRRIDKGKYILHEDYLLSYDYWDGWTERFLRMGIYIDIIFECKVDINFSKTDKDREKIEKQFECELPLEVKAIISEIINLDVLTLKHYYADMTVEDWGSEDYVINHNGISHNIGIGTILKTPQTQNQSEKLFFTLYDLLDKWREKIYEECLQQL